MSKNPSKEKHSSIPGDFQGEVGSDLGKLIEPWCPCSLQKIWRRWPSDVPSNHKDSMTLCLESYRIWQPSASGHILALLLHLNSPSEEESVGLWPLKTPDSLGGSWVEMVR